jgi:hypothetical protein
MWQAIGASAKGTSHINTGSPCQDAHGYLVSDNIAIAAVADGLGSAIKSYEGANLAVKISLEVLMKELKISIPANNDDWINILHDVFIKVRECLERAAKEDNLLLRDFGTTLIVAVIAEDWLAIGHIGDGAVVAFFEDRDESIQIISEPQRGEYANETSPITSTDAINIAHFSAHKASIKAVAIFTDGLQNLLISTASGKAYLPFFTPLFDGITQNINISESSIQLEDFLNSARVCKKTDDDKTLVVIGKCTT